MTTTGTRGDHDGPGSKALIHTTLGYALGMGVPAVIQLLSVAVLTRLLLPAEYGILSLAIAVILFANATVFRWQRLSLVRFLPMDRASQLPILQAVSLTTVAAASGVVLIGIALWVAAPAVRVPGELIISALLALLAQALFETAVEYYRAEGRPRAFGILSAGRAAITFVLAVALVMLGFGAAGALLGTAAGFAVAAGVAFTGWPRGAFQMGNAKARDIRTVLGFGLPLVAAGALTFVVSTSDRLLLGWLASPVDLGVFSSAQDISKTVILLAMLVIHQGALPLAIRAYERGGSESARAAMRRIFAILLVTSAPLSAMLCLLAPEIVDIMLGSTYRGPAAAILPWLVVGGWLAGFRAYYVDISFQLAQQTSQQAGVMAGAAALNVLINLALIPQYGALGAALGSVVAYGAAIGAGIYLAPSETRPPIPWDIAWRVAAATIAMVVVVLSTRAIFPSANLAVLLGVSILSYGAVTLGVSRVILAQELWPPTPGADGGQT